MNRWLSLDYYLQRLGGWYVLLIVGIAQIPTFIGALLGNLYVRHNAGFDPKALVEISRYTPFLILATNLLLLALAWYLTPKARLRLTDWTRNQLKANPDEELAAWQEITALSMRYGTGAIFISYLVSILPTAVYYLYMDMTNVDQLVYSLLGGLASVLATTLIAVLIIDRFSTPARLALVPRSFDAQLQGLSGARLTYKFLVLILILLAISILLLGPVGFHYTSMSLPSENPSVRQAFQFEATVVSLFTLILGALLAYFISRTVSVPLRDLIESFKAVEAGDLSQRATITATDEIAEVTMHFNRMVASLEELQGSLEKQVQERTRLLKATNDIAKVWRPFWIRMSCSQR